MNPLFLYALMCDYVERHGWQREEPGSGWWHKDTDEMLIGEAVQECLFVDQVDVRENPYLQGETV